MVTSKLYLFTLICIERIKMIKRGICHCMITDLVPWLSMS